MVFDEVNDRPSTIIALSYTTDLSFLFLPDLNHGARLAAGLASKTNIPSEHCLAAGSLACWLVSCGNAPLDVVARGVLQPHNQGVFVWGEHHAQPASHAAVARLHAHSATRCGSETASRAGRRLV